MVQDKEKLREVGLEPDKPAGHIRAIWALTLILAFALIVVGGIYFILWYSPWNNDALKSLVNKTDETKNWQTYTDKTNDLTFKYPTDWQYKDYGTTGVLFYQKDKESQFKDSKWATLSQLPGGIGYHVETGTLANSVAKFIAENSSCTSEDKKVADKDGKFVKCPPIGNSGKTLWYYLVENNGKTFYLLTVDESNKSTLDKMVGTMSFGVTASPTASPSANLKTYKDQYLTFNYPSDWAVESMPLFGGSVYIDLNLGIPNQTESSVGYSSAPYSGVLDGLQKSTDLVSINDITVSGVTGKKAIRQGTNYYSYDIIVPVADGSNTFGIHYVTGLNTKNKDEIAAKLDDLVKTIELYTK